MPTEGNGKQLQQQQLQLISRAAVVTDNNNNNNDNDDDNKEVIREPAFLFYSTILSSFAAYSYLNLTPGIENKTSRELRMVVTTN